MTLHSSEGGGSENDGSGDVGVGIGERSRYNDTFGPLLPIAEAVDAATGGWGLSYADLHPVTPRTTIGRAFLATNFFYAAAGLWLMASGDWFYGGLTELAGVVSFVYHYTQFAVPVSLLGLGIRLSVHFLAFSMAFALGVYGLRRGGGTSVEYCGMK